MKPKSDIPVSERMKQIRGGELTANQQHSASAFLTKKQTRQQKRTFDGWFEKCVQLDALESDLPKASERVQSIKKEIIAGIEDELTPASKAAAIENNREFKKAALEYFREYGAPRNITHFLDAMREKGVLERTYGSGESSDRKDSAARDILRKTFGIVGKPGRPKRKPA